MLVLKRFVEIRQAALGPPSRGTQPRSTRRDGEEHRLARVVVGTPSLSFETHIVPSAAMARPSTLSST